MHGDDHTVRNNRSTGKLCEVRSGDEDMDAPIPPQCTDFGKAGRDADHLHRQVQDSTCLCAQRAARAHSGRSSSAPLGEPFKAQNTTLRNNDRAATRVANSLVPAYRDRHWRPLQHRREADAGRCRP